MSTIEFDRKVGKQITINRRAEFTFPTKDGPIIEAYNEFPQQYKVIIGKGIYSGGLYSNPRPYYYFEIHKNGHNAFFNLVENLRVFHVKVDLHSKVVHVEKIS
ncbi:MAG: hypothetical protein Q7U03_14435 [Syntrophales bacterium]|nr:hypothetical protein [Syntrophales bacterium]